MTELKTFICGLSLKQGTVIIGVVQSIAAFMFLALSAAYAGNPHELIDMSDPSIVPSFTILKSVLIFMAVGSALQCIFSILLIFGAETNRPLLLVPWLLINPLTIATYVVCTILSVFHYAGGSYVTFVLGHVVIGTSFCLTLAYEVLVVYSFYKFLKSLNF
ncbi:hypothetical protein AMK59_6153 [Oryctes borbonicus]|uniref:MARVEL domain-containing protein n=1 Tax=Oryctes borbonicus TaxID=1629725 RepID=A0A0T6B259_9SCAR|nr:hypothetical protein AMK59_6153 [Oryctes borbonicus]